MKIEGYARDREEEIMLAEKESLARRKAEIESMPKELMDRAKLKNENGFELAKEKFEVQFRRFKEATNSTEVQKKLTTLDDLIRETQKMFEYDITSLSKSKVI